MLARATRILAPAHAACTRGMHAAARLLAAAPPASAASAAASAASLFPRFTPVTAVAASRLRPSPITVVASPPLPSTACVAARRFATFARSRVPSGADHESLVSRIRRVLDEQSYPGSPLRLVFLSSSMLLLYLALDERLYPEAHEAQRQATRQLLQMEWKRDEARCEARASGGQLSPAEEAQWEEAIAPLRKQFERRKYDYLGVYHFFNKHFGTDATHAQKKQ